MTSFTTTRRTTAHRPVFTGVFGRFADILGVWRQRRHLAKLDDASLNDIGLTRAEADAESQKPIWDVPQHWRRG